jgi:hypothetical protein
MVIMVKVRKPPCVWVDLTALPSDEYRIGRHAAVCQLHETAVANMREQRKVVFSRQNSCCVA